jgi:hypothetical protein
MDRRTFATRVGATVIAAALSAGCGRIDVDLSSTPSAVRIGEPVTFNVTLTNRSTCPLGNVTALLLPFVPKDLLINRIQDPAVRQTLSDAVDAFCTGGTFDIPGSGGCQISNGELTCMGNDTAGDTTSGALATATMLSTGDGNVTCETDGSHITCHIPQSIVAMGEQIGADATANSLSPVVCGAGPNGRLGACFTLKLDPSETKSGQFMLTPTDGGLTRNWILAFATRNKGVCKTGTKGVPCSGDSDCSGMSNTCGSGMCSGGSNDGFGCDDSTECPDPGVCVACTVPPDGQLLSNLACTTTNVVLAATKAPMLSSRGLIAAVVLLLAVAYLAFRRTRNQTE